MRTSTAAAFVLGFDVAPDVSFVAGGVVGLSLFFLVVAGIAVGLRTIKKSLVNACPVGLMFQGAAVESYPELDLQSLSSYTEGLQELGFVHLADYTISAEHGTVQPGFARLFGNEQLACYAEINQLFPVTATVPMRVVFVSRFTEDWSAVTTDRVADAGVWLLRRPTACWRSAPGESVANLLAVHTDLCRTVIDQTRSRVRRPVSSENWYDDERRNAVTVRQCIEKRNILVLLWEYFTFSGRTEWLGRLIPARSNASNDYN